MKITGKTKICGIIGNPVEHTLSPTMHNAAFEELNLDYIYLAFKVKRIQLIQALKGVSGLTIHGLNVTMPHKNTIIKYLDEVDSITEFIGASNTILNNKGKLLGFNTDGAGAVKALKNNGVKLSGKKILILGASGAAKAIAFQLAEEVDELKILNRTPKKAKKLAEILGKKFNKKITSNSINADIIKDEVKNSDVLINATSVGMYPKINESLIDPKYLKKELTVMDIVYNPLETKLMKDAKAIGSKIINGIEMLIYQGGISFEIWTGKKAPIRIMRNAIMNKISRNGE